MPDSADLPHYEWPVIADLVPGEQVDSFFAVRKAELRRTRENKPFLVLDLGDRSGHIRATLWDDAETYQKALPAGTIVKLRATPAEYAGKLELKVHLIRPVTDADEVTPDHFLPRAAGDPEQQWAELVAAVEQVENPGLQLLLQNFVNDQDLSERFKLSPAGKKWHHATLGGLLEHTVSLLGLVQHICEHYPRLNKDLLIAGAVFHDIGKLWELQASTVIDYSVRGRLEGHIVLGAEWLQARMDAVDDLDDDTKVQLKHLVLSHQGELEYGSPVVPKTPEAFVLYYLDEIDSKLNALDREYEKYAGSPEPFTGWINLLERHLYKPPRPPRIPDPDDS